MGSATETAAEWLSARLIEARALRQPISTQRLIPPVHDEAYKVQARVAKAWGEKIGWKVGKGAADATPTCAPIFRSFVYDSGANIATGAFKFWRIETEIAFRIGRDLPARREAYSTGEVRDAIKSMLLCFEIVDSRYEEWPDVPQTLLIADLMSHGAIVLGPEVEFDPTFNFATPPISLAIDGVKLEIDISNPADDILELVCWLATSRGLQENDLVATGSYTGTMKLAPGETAAASLGALGSVSVRRNAGAAWSD